MRTRFFAPLLALCVSVTVSCQLETPPADPFTVTTRLVTLLEDPSDDVRRTAALSLGKIGHAAGLPALVQALSDPDPQVREYSAWALGQIEEDVNAAAVIGLVEALGDEHHAVKRAAARALGNVGSGHPIVALLTEALAVGTVGSRRAVVEALMQLEVRRASSDLQKAAADPDPLVRQGAIAALGELADRRALVDFRQRLLFDEDAGVRAEAAYRLGKLGDAEDVPTLERAANHDPTPAVRLWAAWAKASITGEEGTEIPVFGEDVLTP